MRKERFLYLCFVQWGFLCPLKHVLVDVAVVAAEHRSQMDIVEVKGIHQCHCIGTNDSQELLHMLVHLGYLGTGQDTSLEREIKKDCTGSQILLFPKVSHRSAFPHTEMQQFIKHHRFFSFTK